MKAIRWASDRIGDEGVVAFVTNNGFLDAVAFDGMRKHLAGDFTKIYHIDLKGMHAPLGNAADKKVATFLMTRSGLELGLVFFIKKAGGISNPAEVWIYSIDDYLKAREKQERLTNFGEYTNVPMKQANIDAKHTWLTEGLHAEFDTFIPMGTKAAKAVKGVTTDVIFKTYSNGVKTNRDAWAFNFNPDTLTENIERMLSTYNAEVDRWKRQANKEKNVDNFVVYDDTEISWSRDLKVKLKRGTTAEYASHKMRTSLYRPFTQANLYFDRLVNDVVYVFPSIFPTPASESENRVICVNGIGSNKPFHPLMVDVIPCLGILDANQSFPFYTYAEDGTNRRENITDWALAHFRTHYENDTLTKWDIFHYIYGLLHHPDYREKYEANLKRDLPHIPLPKISGDLQKQANDSQKSMSITNPNPNTH